jgi:2,3-dihydroxy-2,3-dihydro-p-cumate dehydrogenase
VTEKPLSEMTAVVTGAARGIGLAIATRLAADGARVVVADTNCELLDVAAAELGAVSCVADLSTETGARALINASGPADILVNNAGGGVIRPFLEHTNETLHATINRNLWTTIWCCRTFLPAMIERGRGRIINISADSVHTGTYSHAGYNAAKGGVNGLTTGLAFEFGRHGITVNAVSPGGVMTPELERLLEADEATMAQYKMAVNPAVIMESIPIRRFTEMNEVAALVAFLAGSQASAINGQIYSINGGQWML